MSNPSRRTLETVIGIAVVLMLTVTLSALSVVRADEREGELVATGDGGGSANSGDGLDSSTGDGLAAGDEAGEGGGETTASDPAAPGGPGGDTPGDPAADTPAPGGDAPGGPGGGPGGTDGGSAQPGATGGGQPGGATACPDYNPDEGVFCDRWIYGGTTILSGPLAIYGEQGLKGNQAWNEWFRREQAPALKVRPGQLVYYDDNLEPRKTLQFVKRLVEEDKVLVISGVTNPGAIASYLEEKGVPFIGDLGLNPGSYKSTSIFPTNAPFEVGFRLRARTAKRKGAKTIAVIQDVLPATDPKEFERLWGAAAKAEGLELLSYQSIDSQASSCDSRMLNALRDRPEWIMLPVAAGPMLACMREAATQQAKPGSVVSPQLINWSGGSNLAFEVEQCGQQCYGMYSAGTPFLDPRTNKSPEAKQYIENMAKYAPGIDVTGFIAINYYHAGPLVFEVMKQGGILNNLSRANLLKAAEGFGPYETGFGNTVHWKAGQVPRIPTTCGYEVILDPKQKRWVFQTEKLCL